MGTEQRQWYVMAATPGCERKVSTRAADLGIPTYYPIAKYLPRPSAIRRAQSCEFIERPAFGRYVFVSIRSDKPEFHWLLEIEDVCGFLSNGGAPELIDDDIVLAIRQREQNGDFNEADTTGRYAVPRWVKRATQVRITSGPFIGHFGSISRIINGRAVSIWLQMFGSISLIDIPISYLEKAA